VQGRIAQRSQPRSLKVSDAVYTSTGRSCDCDPVSVLILFPYTLMLRASFVRRGGAALRWHAVGSGPALAIPALRLPCAPLWRGLATNAPATSAASNNLEPMPSNAIKILKCVGYPCRSGHA
jgi:hypothetical protein